MRWEKCICVLFDDETLEVTKKVLGENWVCPDCGLKAQPKKKEEPKK